MVTTEGSVPLRQLVIVDGFDLTCFPCGKLEETICIFPACST